MSERGREVTVTCTFNLFDDDVNEVDISLDFQDFLDNLDYAWYPENRADILEN